MQSINELISSITDGSRAAHAFIIECRDAERRREFSDTVAAGLLCSHPDIHSRPCGRCPACRQAAAGTSLDLIRMKKSVSSGRSGRETYKVEDAAAFIERLSMGSYGRHLVGIVDDADILSETIQNKLLKTLEEPAPGTVILLSAGNRDNLLSTVRSRCAEIRAADYAEYQGDAEDEGRSSDMFGDLIRMMLGRDTLFCDFRAAAEKTLKTREDTLAFLGSLESGCRDRMVLGGSGDPLAYAAVIELINTARMDIRREMNHIKALKRLFLEINREETHTW